ncbi:MAG: DUF2066 domain-containing protein [Geminicoccaceae bacterium]
MRNEASARSWWLHAAAVALALLAMASTADAADMYRVQGVPVDATADSGVAAREVAITAGKRDGLRRLMQRLTAPSAHGRLPDVSTGAIEQYVNSFEIAQEKVGPNRYIGTLNVSYVATAVQALLEGAGIPYVIRRSDPILVVPVELIDDAPVAWVDASPWRAAWYDGIDQATVTVLALPLGDLADIAAASPEAIMSADRASLDALAGRYGTSTVVVATASLRYSDPAGPLSGIDVTVRREDAWNRPLLKTVIEPAPGEPPEATMNRAVGAVIASIEDNWKAETIGQTEAMQVLPVVVPLAGLRAWVQISRDLGTLEEIRSVTLDMFSQSEARVQIGFVGDLEPLKAAVGRVGLALDQESDGWRLHPADEPAALDSQPYVSPATP